MEISKQDYVRRILEAYRTTPGTAGVVRRNDRILAANLYDRGVEPLIVENALVLAAARRLFRRPNAPPLQPIRSLHYLTPVIEEVLRLCVSEDYFRYLRFRIQQKQRNTPS
jgi:hypothetical protein